MESVSNASKDEDTGWEYSSVGACCAYCVRKGFGLIFSIIKIYCVKDQGQLWESALSFYHVGSKDGTQVIRLGGAIRWW